MTKLKLKIIKSHVFCLFLFLKLARRSLTHFSPLSAHAQHCDNSEPQTDLDRRSWFFDGTFIRNSQKKLDRNFECFLARKSNNFFHFQSRFIWAPSTCHFVFVCFCFYCDGVNLMESFVDICCFQLISAEIKLCL